MDKKIGFILSLLIIYFVYAQRDTIQNFFLERYNGVKSSYFDTVLYISNLFETHFNQAITIKEQKLKINELTKQNTILLAYKNRFDNLVEKPLLKDVIFVNAISYVNLANDNRMWLQEFESFTPQKTYGAIDGRYTLGIVVAKDDKPMILLNSDPQSIYSVHIGKEKAPGVIYGVEHRRMLVKYIPQWMEIQKGDVVKTSGLDNIFIPEIEVGVVTEVEVRHGYKIAHVQPYADSLSPDFFYLID
jgi:rod shape-determining protein MreC